jgi:lipopolysaccharide/colanic/teichoic acid biosynthesis glycosyltransferase
LGEDAPLEERLPLELHYADHYSLRGDLQILVRSLMVWKRPRDE